MNRRTAVLLQALFVLALAVPSVPRTRKRSRRT